MDHEDLAEFLDELGASAITHASSETALAEVEDTCGRWRAIAEAQHAHNTAPGPMAEESADRLARFLAPADGEHYPHVHHEYRTGRDMPEVQS